MELHGAHDYLLCEFLSAELQVGLTPVIIADELQWVDAATQEDDTTLSPLADKFVAKGPIFGASAGESQIIVQARKSSSLIVRGPDGVTYFARQLATGQAYRAPIISGLSIEVFDAGALQLFVAGESHGLVPVGKSTVAQLVPNP